MNSQNVLTKEAWPAAGITQGSNIEDYTWGYLIHDGVDFTFDGTGRPSNDEIMRRWHYYLNADTVANLQRFKTL